MMERDYHIPALAEETLRYLAPQPGETALDATLGGGGHSALWANALQPGGTLIGLDRDPEAIQAAGERLQPFQTLLTIILISTPFGKMEIALEAHPATAGVQLDGALFDLGVSSHQLDAERGFSFRRDEPLDMRMNPTEGRTAAELLATASEAEIARILWEYGEERFSRRIARAIVERRQAKQPVQTTGEFAALIERVVPRAAHPRDIHVATRSFQGVRIAVNEEMEQLQAGLDAALRRLKPGGRIVVLSYHSLEDRIVKQTFAQAAGKRASASGFSPAVFAEEAPEPTLTLLTKKPVMATPEEVARNPRARSAKLRAALRL